MAPEMIKPLWEDPVPEGRKTGGSALPEPFLNRSEERVENRSLPGNCPSRSTCQEKRGPAYELETGTRTAAGGPELGNSGPSHEKKE